MELKHRLFKDPGDSFFLFGPRGTGKSTWLKEAFPNLLYIDLLSPEVFRSLSARPERLRQLIEAEVDKAPIVIDEIQKLPVLLDLVHQMLETRPRVRFVLTGSSARKLRRTGVDLLAGRALLKTFHPFVGRELGDSFNLDAALRLGMLPLVRGAAKPEETLRAYAGLYLKEEVQAEGIVRNTAGFSRFLEAISFSHSSLLNISDVARDCETGRKTVEAHVAILEDLLLSFRVPVFTRRAKRLLISHPKFYFFDCGVFRSVRPAGPFDRSQEIDGAALEGLVAQHLRAWISYGWERMELFFWRTKSGNEVDFVLYGPEGMWAVEVKNSPVVRPRDLVGLKAFRDDYPEAKLLLLHRGTDRLLIDGIFCIPCAFFLERLMPGSPLPD